MSAMFSTAPNPIVEFREDALKPAFITKYLANTEQTADLRKALIPLRLYSLPDTGGKLNVATHVYYYAGGHPERDAAHARMAENPQWQTHLEASKAFIQNDASVILVESPFIQNFAEIQGLANNLENDRSHKCIFEIRRYNLILGYDTVPKFMKLYEAGLPSKLHAEGTDPTTSLITLLYSEVGRLNEVIEIWRHGDGTAAMERSRVAARGASPWRKSIAEIAPLAIDFTSTIHKPMSFSPFK
jgi:NIPSNAP